MKPIDNFNECLIIYAVDNQIDYQQILDNANGRIPLIIGPTASGKTSVAIALARELDAEIISIDSRQIYQGFRIGTAQPKDEERAQIPHHLVDCLSPESIINAAEYCRLVDEKINKIHNIGKVPLIAGGSMMYVRALLEGIIESPDADLELRKKIRQQIDAMGQEAAYHEFAKIDPRYAASFHWNDKKKLSRAYEILKLNGIPPTQAFAEQQGKAHNRRSEFYCIEIHRPRAILYERIEKRVDEMIAEGWQAELQNILNSGVSADVHPMQSLGYRNLLQVMSGEVTLEDAIIKIKTETRRFAKRQGTWLRKLAPDCRIMFEEICPSNL